MYGGRLLTDDEITGLLIATLFAGQHTSSITSAWTGYFMIANKARSRFSLSCAHSKVLGHTAALLAQSSPCAEAAPSAEHMWSHQPGFPVHMPMLGSSLQTSFSKLKF